MNRELLLLRHGKAESFDPRGDFFRELKGKGKRGAQRIAIWLATHHRVPDHVISSNAERAAATARKCCKAMGFPAHLVVLDELLYQAPPGALLYTLQNAPSEARRVMLVGHNPGLEQLLQSLCEPPPAKPADHNLMPTTCLARLAIPVPWREMEAGCAQLLELQRSDDLPGSFPFETAHGIEQRSRPAYYYRQSSVIPYRVEEDRVQILIVRSSSNKHWVVPKGIADPGMTPQESALNEAFEEAGVEGRITGTALGSYDYPKWGASCTVQVYPMQVERELSDQEWQENYRGRRWVSPETASMLLKQQALAPMIENLAAKLREHPCPA